MDPKAAIKILTTEILDQVKLVATGKQNSIFPLIEKGKDLIELESAVQPETTEIKADDF